MDNRSWLAAPGGTDLRCLSSETLTCSPKRPHYVGVNLYEIPGKVGDSGLGRSRNPSHTASSGSAFEALILSVRTYEPSSRHETRRSNGEAEPQSIPLEEHCRECSNFTQFQRPLARGARASCPRPVRRSRYNWLRQRFLSHLERNNDYP